MIHCSNLISSEMMIMERTLTLDLPEEIYEPLAEAARKRGSTPEDLAKEWLVSALHHAMSDPIEKFIGAFNSRGVDWADQHDSYLGQAVMKEVIDEEARES